MPAFKITVAYDGTDFVGWQRQASGISIQGLVEAAARELDERDVVVNGAGRTDAGVHALAQVASFSLHRSIEASAVVRALNARLPATVRVVDAEEVGTRFHARFDATHKLYRYRIWNAEVQSPFERTYAWHVSGGLDTDAMREAAGRLVGRRDFAAFQGAGGSITSTERELFSSLVQRFEPTGPGHEGMPPAGAPFAEWPVRAPDAPAGGRPLVTYDVCGSGFLRHMVRNIVGSLVEVGRGRQTVEWMSRILEGRDRALAGPTAPAHGLVLVAVAYGLQSPFVAKERVNVA